jgi:hypothetical protein
MMTDLPEGNSREGPGRAALVESAVAKRFASAGACSAATARSAADLGVLGSPAFAALCRRRILREAQPGNFYLDERGYHRRHAVRRVLVVGALTLLVGLAWAVFRAAPW